MWPKSTISSTPKDKDGSYSLTFRRDSVDREALLTILKAYKFDRTIVSFIRMSMLPYKIFSEQLGIEFLVERGVPQGWSLSCVLFNLVIDPLLRLLNKNTPRLFQSAFADDLSFHHQCYHMLPIVQRCINEYGGSVGLSVNEKKCAVMALGDQHPTNSIWNAPTVTEYKYLGVLLGRQVTKERVFKDAFNKLADRTKLFSKIQVNPTTKILLAKLYMYPLISYLLNFYSLPPLLENRFMSLIQKFIFPFGNINKKLLFAEPSVFSNPNLEHPRAYAMRFTFTDGKSDRLFHLLEPTKKVKPPPKLDSKQLLQKISKMTNPTRSLICNMSTIREMPHKVSHF
jgi:hypothetical protein